MSTSSKRVSRKQFVSGLGAAAASGLVVGGASGFFGGRASESSAGGSAATSSTKPITIGAGVPVTGAFSGDGQEMLRGLQLGVAEINANGGLLGRQLKISVIDTKEQAPDVMTNAMRQFVSAKVAAIFAPFLTYSSVEFPIVGPSNIPMFHVNTYQGNLDYVRKHGYTNIYEGCPSQIWYGHGFTLVIDEILKSGAWTPSSKTIAVVTSNDPYSLTIAQAFRAKMESEGWKTTVFEEFSIPQADWGPVLVKIRKNPPGIIFFSDYTAGDEASFIKQFHQAPTKSLVYQQYAPSVPEYLKLAGKAADGVLWSTVIGSITTDEIGKKFVADYTAKFKQAPGLSNAGAQYDLVRLWAQAAALAGDPYDYAAVNKNVQQLIFRGVSGAFRFMPGDLAAYAYPDQVKDPSIGMPHLTFQIQNGKQELISPSPYATAKFTLPPWFA
ncbi:MAG: ABC transporter substrate-binding protein [Rhodospirillales bacterium]|nr:ABC transporter substrate-binding protein [Rhodospirillales bacterium]